MQKIRLIIFLLIASPAIAQPSQSIPEIFRTFSNLLGSPLPSTPTPQRCPAPNDYGWWQAFTLGEQYYTPNLGVFIVKDQLLSSWTGEGKTTGRLGFPVSHQRREQTGIAETVDVQDFEGGQISFNHVAQRAYILYNNRMLGPGRYRLILCGFKVEKESTDNMFETDGKGDEIYIRTDAFLTDKNGVTVNAPNYQTKVFGDVNGQENRIMAGTRSDRGGLRTNDMHPSPTPWIVGTMVSSIPGNGNQLPMKIWEGEINNGNRLFIIPSIWEWDEHRTSELENNWGQLVNEVFTLAPYHWNRLRMGRQHTGSTGVNDGNLPFGRLTNSHNNTSYISVNTPIIIANKQGFYFGYNYEVSRPNNDMPHGGEIYEAVFRNQFAPYGTYRLYLKWEKLSFNTKPGNHSGIIK